MSESFTVEDALKVENVRFVSGVTDWKDAVRLATEPLIECGCCEARYADGIIENTEKFGPYYILCPGLALLHGRPEQGALKTQISVTVARDGVDFGGGQEPVTLMVTLAAVDSDMHLEVMRAMAMLFSQPGAVEELCAMDSAEAIYQRFLQSATA